MANVVKIRRSAASSPPSSLAAGELAYAENAGVGGAGILYYGSTGGSVLPIGGPGLYGSPVTSVGLTAPAQFSVSGSPVAGSGTLGLSWANQSANTVLAGPTSGGAAAPTFRALASGDLPAHNHAATDITSGTLNAARLTGSYTGITAINAAITPIWTGLHQFWSGIYVSSLRAEIGGDAPSSGTHHNVAIDDSVFFYWNGATPSTVTGFGGGVEGRVLFVKAIVGVTLKHMDAGSVEANRIYTRSGGDLVLSAGQCVLLLWDGTAWVEWLVG